MPIMIQHDVTTERGALVYEVLSWLDKYLGRVEEHRRGVRENAPFQGVRDLETNHFHAELAARFKISDPLKRSVQAHLLSGDKSA